MILNFNVKSFIKQIKSKKLSTHLNTSKIGILKNEKTKEEKVSLKVKLILSHIVITIIPILIIVITLTSQASSSLLNKINSSNLAYVSKVTKIFDDSIKNFEDSILSLVTDVDFNTTISKDIAYYNDVYEMGLDRDANFTNKIRNVQYTNKMIKNIFLLKEIEVIGSVSFDKKVFLEDFFKSDVYQRVQSVKNGNVWFYDLYDTNDIYVMRSISSIATGKFVGILVFQVDKEMFVQNLNSDFGDLAKLALVDSSGQVIVTPKNQDKFDDIQYFDEINNQLKESVSSNIGTFTTTTEVDVETSVLFGKCINNWVYILQIPVNEFLGDIQKIRSVAIFLTAILTLFAILVGTWMALSISKPIDYIIKKIKLVEQGDLTAQSKYRGKYELGKLSNSFNNMTMNMNNLIKGMEKVVNKVSVNSNELKIIASNSAQALMEVVQAVESVTSGANEQAQDAEHASVVIKDLIYQFCVAEEHFNYVVKVTNDTRVSCINAKEIIQALNIATNDSIELTQCIQENIQYLVNSFNQMSSITGIIDSISEQTNLLALNAAIEASRAGEQGKGFAVVADEIRKLSIQSSDAVRHISNIIECVSKETINTHKMLEKGNQIYEKQEKAVVNTRAIFDDILYNMNIITNEVNLVYNQLEGLDNIQCNATDSITSIAAIAEETAASIEEVLATGQEQMYSADQLVRMSMELGNVITVMEKQISKFKLLD